MEKHEYLSQMQLDVLKEVSNIGAGHAATALSKLVGKKITMQVPDVLIVSFNEMVELVGGADQEVASIYLQYRGEMNGNMFFVLPVHKATMFVKNLTGLKNFSFADPPFPEMALSAFQELGNILAGSYLTALSDFLDMVLIPEVPAVSVDMFGAIITHGLLEISMVSDYAIVIDTEIKDPFSLNGNRFIKAHLLLLPDPDSFQKLFRKLDV